MGESIPTLKAYAYAAVRKTRTGLFIDLTTIKRMKESAYQEATRADTLDKTFATTNPLAYIVEIEITTKPGPAVWTTS